MKPNKLKKGLSLLLAVVMLITCIPYSNLIVGAEGDFPLMKPFNSASGDDFHRYYNQVYSVTFLDEIDTDAMNNSLEYWDISAEDGSGDVMAWMYLNEEATASAGKNLYDVYVAGEGGVAAHEDTTHMFYVFTSLREVVGMENLHTGRVKNFMYWFGNCYELENVDLSKLDTSSATTFKFFFFGCYKLKEIDASSWDVSNVTSLERMFYRCYALEYANLSGWNTKNVTSMYGLFEMTPPNGVDPDYCLKGVDLSGWDTSNVTTMENMFKNCKSLETLDLSSFDTSKVTTMRFMFYYCNSLKNIYVGEGWTTEAIKNVNDGVFNCCYTLIGGKDDRTENEKIYAEKHPSAYYPPSVEYAKTKEEGGYLTDVSQKPEAEKKKYTVTYEFVGDIIPEGVSVVVPTEYEERSTVAVADPSEAAGYVFSGWSTEDADIKDGEFVINSDVHFVGSWTKLYKVEYKYTDGFEVPEGAPEIPDVDLYFAPGEDVPVYGIPYVYEYVFVGWNTEDADVVGDSFIMPENDVVFYGFYKIPVKSVEIMDGEDISVNINEEAKITVYVKPENATIPEISFESSNEDVVKVDKFGNITPVGEGEATITVKSVDDLEKMDSIKVIVKVPVTNITVDKTEITINRGNEDRIITTVTPDEATNKKLIYKSSDETVVTVDQNGNITAVGEGKATITITSEDNKNVKEEISVTVKNPVTKLDVAEDFTLNIGEEKNVDAKVNEDATNKELFYESSDPEVIKIDPDGNVIAVGKGEATITITSKDDPTIKKTVTVTVIKPVTDIIVDKTELNLDPGKTDKITVIVTPDDATDKGVVYESSDETIVKVDENGNVEAIGEGTATITVSSKYNGEVKETITVTVKKPVSEPEEPQYSYEIPELLSIVVGEKQNLGVKVYPEDAQLKMTYKSDNENVVSVDADGNITGVSEGYTTITVYFSNGDLRAIPVVVIAPPPVITTPKHHICFGKTDGIGWYEVSVNGGDFFPQGPNSTLEVEEGSILVVRVQDMWIDDEFDFYVNGKKVERDAANTITVVVDGYMLIGALSMDVEVPDAEESLNIFQKLIKAIREFFRKLFSWL